jgi:transketolase
MKDYKFELGKGCIFREGKDVSIVATGYMVHLAVEAAEILAKEGIEAEVINIHTVKPLDKELIVSSAKKCGAVVTAEEHSVIGGLGSAVAEVVCEGCPVPVVRLGIEDKFGHSGKVPPLMEMYGITVENLIAKAKIALAMKN